MRGSEGEAGMEELVEVLDREERQLEEVQRLLERKLGEQRKVGEGWREKEHKENLLHLHQGGQGVQELSGGGKGGAAPGEGGGDPGEHAQQARHLGHQLRSVGARLYLSQIRHQGPSRDETP